MIPRAMKFRQLRVPPFYRAGICGYYAIARCARKEVLRHLLDINKLSFNSVQQALNFIAIMLGKEKIQDIIKAEIDKVVSESYKVDNDKKERNPR